MDEGIENHGAAFIEVDCVFIEAGVGIVIGRPAVDFEGLGARCAICGIDLLAACDFGILWKCEFSHVLPLICRFKDRLLLGFCEGFRC